MKFSVLIPYRPDNGWRDRAWAWNLERWRYFFEEDAEFIIRTPGPGKNDQEFNHPKAINEAASLATTDFFVIADADTTFNPDWLTKAINLAIRRNWWVMAKEYESLTEASTKNILSNEPSSEIKDYDIEWKYVDIGWSGVIVVPRFMFTGVGGYDERFDHHSGDDVAFSRSVVTLFDSPIRLNGSVMHLWHPRGNIKNPPQHLSDLMHRYLDAGDDVAAMKSLLAERE